MKQFKNGVTYYTKATCEIFFPEGNFACQWCPLLNVEVRTERKYCQKTGEYIAVPQAGVGYQCPLEIVCDKETGEILRV